HKSDVGGVKLNLADAAALKSAYADLKSRLGPRTIVMPMAQGESFGKGVELSLGMIHDPQFGAVVMLGAGGVLIDRLKDRRYALAPLVEEGEAERHLNALALRPLLDGKRGAAPADIGSLTQAITRFSIMAADLADLIAEIDVNPFIATPHGCVALDALIVPRK